MHRSTAAAPPFTCPATAASPKTGEAGAVSIRVPPSPAQITGCRQRFKSISTWAHSSACSHVTATLYTDRVPMLIRRYVSSFTLTMRAGHAHHIHTLPALPSAFRATPWGWLQFCSGFRSLI